MIPFEPALTRHRVEGLKAEDIAWARVGWEVGAIPNGELLDDPGAEPSNIDGELRTDIRVLRRADIGRARTVAVGLIADADDDGLTGLVRAHADVCADAVARDQVGHCDGEGARVGLECEAYAAAAEGLDCCAGVVAEGGVRERDGHGGPYRPAPLRRVYWSMDWAIARPASMEGWSMFVFTVM